MQSDSERARSGVALHALQASTMSLLETSPSTGAVFELSGQTPKLIFGELEAPACELALDRATSSLHSTRPRVDIMEGRDTNNSSNLSITTAVNSNTTQAAVVATRNSPRRTITSPGRILLLRGRNTRLYSLNSSLWRWSSSLHNTLNPSHSSNSTISRCIFSLSNNTPII